MNVRINDNIFPLEYLTTPDEIQKGMMGRDSLDGCMGFKLKKGHHSFWMKDCLLSLDIVFVLNNRISRIHQNCQPCDGDCADHYTGIGDHVFEFLGGTCSEFKVGDKVRLYLGSPLNPL